jgi:hypothetical protein
MEGDLVVNSVANGDYSLTWLYQGCSGTTTYLAVKHFVGGRRDRRPLATADVEHGGDQLRSLGPGGDGRERLPAREPRRQQRPPAGGERAHPVLGERFARVADPACPSPREPQRLHAGLRLAGAAERQHRPGHDRGELELDDRAAGDLRGNRPTVEGRLARPATDLHTTTFTSIQDLIINNARYHWESFPAPQQSDNLLAAGIIYPSANGINFEWWNGSSQVAASKTNKNAFFYYDPTTGGPSYYAADVAFTSPPLPALAGFEMAYMKQNSTTTGVADVWATPIDCVP